MTCYCYLNRNNLKGKPFSFFLQFVCLLKQNFLNKILMLVLQLIRSRYPSKENRLFDDVLGIFHIMVELLYKVHVASWFPFNFYFPSLQLLLFFTIRSMAMLFYFLLFHVLSIAHLNMTEVVHHLLLSFPCFVQTARYYEFTNLLPVITLNLLWFHFYVLMYVWFLSTIS